MEKFLLSTSQITNQITVRYMGNLLKRGVKREILFEKKSFCFLHVKKLFMGNLLKRGVKREILFKKRKDFAFQTSNSCSWEIF